MSIILRRVLLSMITRRQNRHLMPINRIVPEKVSRLLVNLPRTILITPDMQ